MSKLLKDFEYSNKQIENKLGTELYWLGDEYKNIKTDKPLNKIRFILALEYVKNKRHRSKLWVKDPLDLFKSNDHILHSCNCIKKKDITEKIGEELFYLINIMTYGSYGINNGIFCFTPFEKNNDIIISDITIRLMVNIGIKQNSKDEYYCTLLAISLVLTHSFNECNNPHNKKLMNMVNNKYKIKSILDNIYTYKNKLIDNRSEEEDEKILYAGFINNITYHINEHCLIPMCIPFIYRSRFISAFQEVVIETQHNFQNFNKLSPEYRKNRWLNSDNIMFAMSHLKIIKIILMIWFQVYSIICVIYYPQV
jgi:hypothetical protein